MQGLQTEGVVPPGDVDCLPCGFADMVIFKMNKF